MVVDQNINQTTRNLVYVNVYLDYVFFIFSNDRERFRELDDTPRAHPYEHMLRENCHPDGSFKPAMCNWAERVCWCVDDAGNQIEDTEMQMTSGQRPVCGESRE